MKTLKLALVATLVAFLMASYANADGFTGKPKKVVYTTLTKAIQKHDLAVAMGEKLDPSFLDNYEQLYVVTFEHKWVVYRILGSRQDWLDFFRMSKRPKSDMIQNRTDR